MNSSIRRGIDFGLVSGAITTLGLIVGLIAGGGSKSVVIGGIIVIAIADAFSDALGIHVSEESNGKRGKSLQRNVWSATASTYFSKLIFALTFVVPFLIFELQTAVYVCIIYGMSVLGVLSYDIARKQNENAFKVVFEHLLIAVIVIVLTNYVGQVVGVWFG